MNMPLVSFSRCADMTWHAVNKVVCMFVCLLFFRQQNENEISNLSCNIVAVQVETLCCAYYHLHAPPTCLATKYDVASWGDVLRKVDSSSSFCNNLTFVARITTEASTCLATNLTSTLVIGCQRSAATQQIKTKKHGGRSRRRRRVWSCRPETLGKAEIFPIQRPWGIP